MVVKNVTTGPLPVNKSIQVSLAIPDSDDGLVLAGQTLDLSKSINNFELMESLELRDHIFNGDLVFVISGTELSPPQSQALYNSGPAKWGEVFNTELQKLKVYEGIASGFIYAKNCLIG